MEYFWQLPSVQCVCVWAGRVNWAIRFEHIHSFWRPISARKKRAYGIILGVFFFFVLSYLAQATMRATYTKFSFFLWQFQAPEHIHIHWHYSWMNILPALLYAAVQLWQKYNHLCHCLALSLLSNHGYTLSMGYVRVRHARTLCQLAFRFNELNGGDAEWIERRIVCLCLRWLHIIYFMYVYYIYSAHTPPTLGPHNFIAESTEKISYGREKERERER